MGRARQALSDPRAGTKGASVAIGRKKQKILQLPSMWKFFNGLICMIQRATLQNSTMQPKKSWRKYLM